MQTLLLAPAFPVLGTVWDDIAIYSFRTLFFLSAILLLVIILLQEGKGGGLASALGGQGAETFGVSSGGVNKVTLVLAGIFLVTALGHAMKFNRTVVSALEDKPGIERKDGITIPDPLKDDKKVEKKDDGKKEEKKDEKK